MYSPRHNIPLESTLWSSRQIILENQIKKADCDVVCLQETCAESFESDFKFMENLGYNQHVLFKKGRFRPATFWKSNRLELIGTPMHRDRCLVTCFKRIFSLTEDCASNPTDSHSSTEHMTRHQQIEKLMQEDYIWIANCHLQAGDNALRRYRQTIDCLDAIRKDHKKLDESLKPKPQKGKNTSKISRSLSVEQSVLPNTEVNNKNKMSNSQPTSIDSSSSIKYSYLFLGDTNIDGQIERHRDGLSPSAVELLLCQGQ